MSIEEYTRKYGFGGLDLLINSLLNDTQNNELRAEIKQVSAELALALKPIAQRVHKAT